MKNFFLLLLLIPNLSLAYDSKVLQGTVAISNEEMKELASTTEFAILDKGEFKGTAFIIFEEKNKKNIKYSTWTGGKSNFKLTQAKLGKETNDYCKDHIKLTFDKNVMNWFDGFDYYAFVDYPKKNQVRHRCLTEREFYQKQKKILSKWADDSFFFNEMKCFGAEWMINHFNCDQSLAKSGVVYIDNLLSGTVSEEISIDQSIVQTKSEESLQECLDLGFKKGTEGLKNCVLELN